MKVLLGIWCWRGGVREAFGTVCAADFCGFVVHFRLGRELSRRFSGWRRVFATLALLQTLWQGVANGVTDVVSSTERSRTHRAAIKAKLAEVERLKAELAAGVRAPSPAAPVARREGLDRTADYEVAMNEAIGLLARPTNDRVTEARKLLQKAMA